eukprot:SAG31_NODE_7856_length_1582_cov_1.328388_2_plen_214_part_00
MLKSMSLFDTTEELISVTREMDDDNSGTIEFSEYLEYIDQRCDADLAFFASYRERCRNTKLGYDGTSWRKQANINWLMGEGIMVLTCLAILAAVVYFGFILIPLAMAYFLTFLFGPIQDILIQRPLLCAGLVVCDKPCVRPGYQQHTSCCGKKYDWEATESDGTPKYLTPRQQFLDDEDPMEDGQWNLSGARPNYLDKAQFCCKIVYRALHFC